LISSETSRSSRIARTTSFGRLSGIFDTDIHKSPDEMQLLNLFARDLIKI